VTESAQKPRPPLGLGIEGKTVMVTGAASGIGRATAQLAADCGARVVGVDIHEPTLRSVVQQLSGSGHLAIPFDITENDKIQELVESIGQDGEPLFGLVHAAAVLRRRHLPDVNEADWNLQVDTNLKASFYLFRNAASAMASRGEGRIVALTSQAWWTGGKHGAVVYAATKGGIVSMIRGMAGVHASDGVLINSIAPGLVDTPMLGAELTDDQLDEQARLAPLGRLARPEEIASIAVFLLSDHASHMTGTTINATGGMIDY